MLMLTSMQFIVALAFGLLAQLIAVANSHAIYDIIPPSTVDSLNLTAYTGRWYQTHTSWIPLHTFEKDVFCAVADYKLATDFGGLFVLNSLNVGNASGTLDQVSGFAVQPLPKADPGKLVLTINTSWKAHGTYWIHALGPIDPSTGLYTWSIVTVPFGLEVFVLARDVTTFFATYGAEVLTLLKDSHFDKPWNTPIVTYQGPLCAYPALPTAATWASWTSWYKKPKGW